MAVKLLITGFENTGKTTLASKIKDSLIFNCDGKTFPHDVVHTDMPKWKGYKHFQEFFIKRMRQYNELYGSLPKTVVFDTITHLYYDLTNYNRRTYSGFDTHSQNNEDIQSINEFIESKLLREKGINVVIMAHTEVDKKTERFTVPAQGQFARTGGFVSFVDESIYIERGEEHLIVLKDKTNAVVRSTLFKDKDTIKIEFNSFDINSHIEAINNSINENLKNKL